ncbi:hypothetical protein D3C87_1428100 [compost metagenome]
MPHQRTSAFDDRASGETKPALLIGRTDIEAQGKFTSDRARLEVSDLHIGIAVLQGLKAAEWHTKLLASAQVFAGLC